jgi:site-specific recombinase XerD
MSKLSSQSSKRKCSKQKRVAISVRHARNIKKMRNASTPLRRRFIEDMELHKYSSGTRKHYLSAALNFCAYYWKPPASISDDEIRSYLNYQANDRCLGSGSMGIIHGALLFLYDKTLRLERPTLAIFRTKKDSPEKVILSQAEVAAALRCVNDIRYRTALELIYCCGLRETEALNLTVRDVDRARGLLSIRGKGDKKRQVPLPDLMLEKLTTLWRSHRHGVLFFPAYHSFRRSGEARSGTLERPILGQTLLNVFQQAVTASGCRKKINIHTLRHSYSCHMLEEGASLISVKNNLGHSNLRTTSVYTHYTTKLRRDGAEATERLANNLTR